MLVNFKTSFKLLDSLPVHAVSSFCFSCFRSLQTSAQYNSFIKNNKEIKVTSLSHRSIIQVSGKDSMNFLQGLLTNDVERLPDLKCMYTMMLNKKGRIDHDILMYWPNRNNDQTILLDCHAESTESIIKTFRQFKLRKKVDITERNDYSVWQAQMDRQIHYPSSALDGLKYINEYFAPNLFKKSNAPFNNKTVVILSSDPRLSWLGWRIVAKSQPCNDNYLQNVDIYHSFRYFFGIPEGPDDILPGKSLPFETNLDFMNGVSFEKGCYLGQELTARSHFTGTIRKRIMPVLLSSHSGKSCESGASLFDNRGNSIGKMRSSNDKFGLALIKLDKQGAALNTLNGIKASVIETHWWPKKDLTSA